MNDEITFLGILDKHFSAVIAIISAIVSGGFTYFISRYQGKTKEFTVKAKVEFEARKILYNTYKLNIEKYFQLISENSKYFGELYTLFVKRGFDENSEEIKIFCDTQRKIIANYPSPKIELQREISSISNSLDLLNNLDKVDSIYNQITNEKNTIADYEKEFFAISNYYYILDEISTDILEQKSEKLFEKYIN